MSVKSFNKIVSLCIALVLILGTGAFAAVSAGFVELSDYEAGALTEVAVSFRLSAKGALAEQNGDSIKLVFDNRFNLPSSIRARDVLVNGIGSKAATVDKNAGRIDIVVPGDLEAGESVTVTLLAGTGIRNPEQSGKYDIGVFTSQDNELAWIPCTILGSRLSDLKIEADPSSAGSGATYNIGFKSAGLSAGKDTIKITFPQGAVMPRSIDGKLIKVNNYALTSAPSVSGRVVSFVVPVSIAANKEVVVAVDSLAGIKNPLMPGDYYITVQTTKDTGAEARLRIITGISQPTVAVEPQAAGVVAGYTVSFTTGPSG